MIKHLKCESIITHCMCAWRRGFCLTVTVICQITAYCLVRMFRKKKSDVLFCNIWGAMVGPVIKVFVHHAAEPNSKAHFIQQFKPIICIPKPIISVPLRGFHVKIGPQKPYNAFCTRQLKGYGGQDLWLGWLNPDEHINHGIVWSRHVYLQELWFSLNIA